jgi:hypothetical protein
MDILLIRPIFGIIPSQTHGFYMWRMRRRDLHFDRKCMEKLYCEYRCKMVTVRGYNGVCWVLVWTTMYHCNDWPSYVKNATASKSAWNWNKTYCSLSVVDVPEGSRYIFMQISSNRMLMTAPTLRQNMIITSTNPSQPILSSLFFALCASR